MVAGPAPDRVGDLGRRRRNRGDGVSSRCRPRPRCWVWSRRCCSCVRPRSGSVAAPRWRCAPSALTESVGADTAANTSSGPNTTWTPSTPTTPTTTATTRSVIRVGIPGPSRKGGTTRLARHRLRRPVRAVSPQPGRAGLSVGAAGPGRTARRVAVQRRVRDRAGRVRAGAGPAGEDLLLHPRLRDAAPVGPVRHRPAHVLVHPPNHPRHRRHGVPGGDLLRPADRGDQTPRRGAPLVPGGEDPDDPPATRRGRRPRTGPRVVGLHRGRGTRTRHRAVARRRDGAGAGARRATQLRGPARPAGPLIPDRQTPGRELGKMLAALRRLRRLGPRQRPLAHRGRRNPARRYRTHPASDRCGSPRC